jgi:hypothetical protein
MYHKQNKNSKFEKNYIKYTIENNKIDIYLLWLFMSNLFFFLNCILDLYIIIYKIIVSITIKSSNNIKNYGKLDYYLNIIFINLFKKNLTVKYKKE